MGNDLMLNCVNHSGKKLTNHQNNKTRLSSIRPTALTFAKGKETNLSYELACKRYDTLRVVMILLYKSYDMLVRFLKTRRSRS